MTKTLNFTDGTYAGQKFKATKLRLLSDGLPIHGGNIERGEGTHLITDSNEVIDGVRRINIDLSQDEFVKVTIEIDILKAELHYLTVNEPFRLVRIQPEGVKVEIPSKDEWIDKLGYIPDPDYDDPPF